MKLPLFLTITQVAEILGPDWDYRRTWRWLKRNDALVHHAGKLCTTIPALRKAFPETFDIVFYEMQERLENAS